MNLLFWNLHGNAVGDYVRECLLENDIDIGVFAEHEGTDFPAVCREIGGAYHCQEQVQETPKVTAVVKEPAKLMVRQEQSRYTLYQMDFESRCFILAGVHLQDRIHTKPKQRIRMIGNLMEDAELLCRKYKTEHMIVIGDFNANPYDEELLDIYGFNAALFRDVIHAQPVRRTDKGTERERVHRRLYNPVLHYLSEEPVNYGSYYYMDDSSPVWHCLDQVLVSAALADSVTELRYLRTIGGKQLVKSVRPDADISDHLPLFVKIDW